MKEVFSLILMFLTLNVICEDPARLVIERYMDKSSKELFKVFHTVFNKVYEIDSPEALLRYKIFKENLKIIKATNDQKLSYTFGVNQFTDLTPEEFRAKHLTNFENLKKQMNMEGFLMNNQENEIAYLPQDRTKIDWKGLFNPARNQGNCGSCWAFASSGTLEANWWNQNQSQNKISIAPQQLVDCNKENYGCDGGWYRPAFDYILKEGMVEEQNYKYTQVAGSCNIPSSARRIKIDNFKGCDDCSIDEWYAMLQQGPIAILMDASDYQYYNGGIMVFKNCNYVTHAIIATGWDKDSQGEIVTIRNSWGSSWGENGFMRVRVNHSFNKSCFATQYGYLPILSGKPPPPPPVDCYIVGNSWIHKDWKLNKPFSGIVSFKATGTEFSVGAFYSNDASYQGYNILIQSKSVTITDGYNQRVCAWTYTIDPKIENSYSLNFSSSKANFTLMVNGVKMVCQNNIWLNYTNYIGFITKESTVKVCNVSVIPSD